MQVYNYILLFAGFLVMASIFVFLWGQWAKEVSLIWVGIVLFLTASLMWSFTSLFVAALLVRDLILTLRGSNKRLKILNNGKALVDGG